MKDSKSIIVRQTAVLAAVTGLGLVFLGLPWLEETRSALAAKLGVSTGVLWLAFSGALLGALVLFAHSLIASVSTPFQLLAFDAEQDQLSYAVRRKSRTREEESLKQNLDGRRTAQREAAQKVEELEKELERVTERLERSRAAKQLAEQRIEELETEQRAFRIENETLKSSKLALELTLDNERQSKVGREVEKRADEIYSQLERAFAAESFRSVWVPNLLSELREPIVRINDVAQALRGHWTENSIGDLERSIGSICALAESQISIIDKLHTRSYEQPVPREPAKPSVSEIPEQLEIAPPAPVAKPNLKLNLSAPVPATETELPAIEDENPVVSVDPIPEEAATLDIVLDEAKPEEIRTVTSDLRALLGGLVDEFATMDTDARFELAVDPDLDVQIEDEALEKLLRALLDISISIVEQGTIAVGVSLEPNRLEFDIACNGELDEADAIDLSKANRWASQLASEVDCEAPSEAELHFTFDYKFE